MCAQYWPNEGNVEFDEYTVSVKEEWSHDSFSRKLLLVRNKKVFKNNMGMAFIACSLFRITCSVDWPTFRLMDGATMASLPVTTWRL